MFAVLVGLAGVMGSAGVPVQDFGQQAAPGHPVAMVPPASTSTAPSVSPPAARPAPTNPHPASPAGNPGTWVTDADYPARALKNGEAGITGFIADVDAKGMVTACGIQSTSGSSVLDEATCQLIRQRGRFFPATDKDGRAVASKFANKVKWSLPNSGANAGQDLPQAGLVISRYVIEADGSRSHCEVISNGGQANTKTGPVTCPAQGFSRAFTDATGKPVRKQVTVTVTQTVVVDEVPK